MEPGEGALDDPADATEAGAVFGPAAGDLRLDPALPELTTVHSDAPEPTTDATASASSGSRPTTAPATRGAIHALACRTLGIKHSRTRPYRPQTNGKAERFIRTMPDGCAYAAIYRSSHERTAAPDRWRWHHNHRRRHSALGHQPPASRTNLLGSYS